MHTSLDLLTQPFESLNLSISFKEYLNKLYNPQTGPDYSEIDYVEPYNGKLGNYPAEIFHSKSFIINEIVKKIACLGLTQKLSSDEVNKTADVIASNCNRRGGNIQIIFTNDKALKIFKEAITKEFKEIEKKEKFGTVSRDTLIQSFPELENLITSSRNGLNNSIEYIVKNEEALIEVKEILRKKLEEFKGKTFGNGIQSQVSYRNKEYCVEISFTALRALEEFCESDKK